MKTSKSRKTLRLVSISVMVVLMFTFFNSMAQTLIVQLAAITG
jgi:hypothetical protein